LFGSIAAASRSSGRSLAEEFRFQRRQGNGGAARSADSVSSARADDERRPQM